MTSTPYCFNLQHKLTFADVRECLPPVLLALADKGEAVFGISPETVAAAGIAHMAAVIGRRHLFDDGMSVLSPGFNFVACSDQVCPADWLTCLGRGWTESANSASLKDLPTMIAMLLSASGGAKPGASSRTADAKPGTAPGGEGTQVAELVSCNLAPANAARLLRHSPDSCLTLIKGAADPMDEYTRLPPGQQRKLSTLLWHSWQGRPMELSAREAAIPATLSCIWSTSKRAASHALFRAFHFGRPTLPMLFFQSKGVPRRFPDQRAQELQLWRIVLKEQLQLRSGAPPEVYPFAIPSVAEEFACSVAHEVTQQPAHLRPWLEWTSDLMPRIFMVLLLGFMKHWDKLRQTKINELRLKYPDAGKAPRIQSLYDCELAVFEASVPKGFADLVLPKAVQLTTWMLQEHFRAVQWLVDEPGMSPLFDNTDSTDKACLPEAILRRLRDNGPLLPRQLQRSFHHVTAKERDEAIEALKSGGLVTQSEDGKLSLPS